MIEKFTVTDGTNPFLDAFWFGFGLFLSLPAIAYANVWVGFGLFVLSSLGVYRAARSIYAKAKIIREWKKIKKKEIIK